MRGREASRGGRSVAQLCGVCVHSWRLKASSGYYDSSREAVDEVLQAAGLLLNRGD